MLKIGLTGSIGSGKSTVSKMFEDQGISIVSSDEIVKSLQRPGNVLWRRIQQNWPGKFLKNERELDRKKLADRLLEDKKFRKEIEQMIHPVVKSEIKKIFKVWKGEGSKIAGAEVPLLFEAGWEEMFDYIVLTYAPGEVLLKRIEKNKSISQAKAKKWLNIQQDQKIKKKKSDIIIDTDKDKEIIFNKVKEIIGKINKES
ncbi:MAG: dephospho-CoA kinase [Elusimicrobiota bacterium]